MGFKKTRNKQKNNLNEFKCKYCGAMLPAGAVYCEECGNRVGKTKSYAFNEFLAKCKQHILATIVVVVAALFMVGSVVVDIVTEFDMPNVEGKTGQEAIDILHGVGFEDDVIEITCNNRTITVTSMLDGEYAIIKQHPAAGSSVHSDDIVSLECEDEALIRTTAIQGCRYMKVPEALEVTKEYEYKTQISFVSLEKTDKEIVANDKKYEELGSTEQDNYYVFELNNFDDDKRTVDFVVGTKTDIEKKVAELFSDMNGKKVAEAETLLASLDFTGHYLDYEGDSSSATSTYVITKVGKVNFDDRSVDITADSEEHIEDLKYLDGLDQKIPYKGLPERLIDKTGAGVHDYKDSNEVDGYTYTWRSDDDKYDVLVVTCSDGKVTKVEKKNESTYWKNSLPDYTVDKDALEAKKAASSGSSSSSSETMVWISGSGSCYHSNRYCSNMKNPWQVPLSQAKQSRRPCSKCY